MSVEQPAAAAVAASTAPASTATISTPPAPTAAATAIAAEGDAAAGATAAGGVLYTRKVLLKFLLRTVAVSRYSPGTGITNRLQVRWLCCVWDEGWERGRHHQQAAGASGGFWFLCERACLLGAYGPRGSQDEGKKGTCPVLLVL
jgi:hypothetical protein